ESGVWISAGDASACHDPSPSNGERPLYFDTQANALTLTDTRGVRICKRGTIWTEMLADLPYQPTMLMPDPHHHRIVVVTDPDRGNIPMEMWTYDGSWHRLPPVPMPPARSDASITYDETRGAAIVYGGTMPKCGATCSLDDTWAYDGSTWTKIASAGPMT